MGVIRACTGANTLDVALLKWFRLGQMNEVLWFIIQQWKLWTDTEPPPHTCIASQRMNAAAFYLNAHICAVKHTARAQWMHKYVMYVYNVCIGILLSLYLRLIQPHEELGFGQSKSISMSRPCERVRRAFEGIFGVSGLQASSFFVYFMCTSFTSPRFPLLLHSSRFCSIQLNDKTTSTTATSTHRHGERATEKVESSTCK